MSRKPAKVGSAPSIGLLLLAALLGAAHALGPSSLAAVLDDTPKNRLILRYMRSAQLAQNRAIRTLTMIQNERKKAVRTAENVALPNEPDCVAEEPAKEDAATSSIINVNANGDTENVSITNSNMESIASTVVAQPSEVAARVENEV